MEDLAAHDPSTPWPSLPPRLPHASPSEASSRSSTTASTSFLSMKTPSPSDPTPNSPSSTASLLRSSCSIPKPLPGETHSLLASSGEFLRLWRVKDSAVELCSLLNNSNSFDWNQAEPRRIGTSSIDATCTVWDVERGVVETQLIAHDKEVYDIAWGGAAVFASVSAGGSIRVFDLRDKEHSAIVYESPRPDAPFLRLAWNKMDVRFMATIVMDGNEVVVLDIRSPSVPVAELQRHRGSVNAVAWAPQTARHLCSVGDDGQVFIWEVPKTVQPEGVDPLLAYNSGVEINQMQWSAAHRDWIGIAFSNSVQLLRV